MSATTAANFAFEPKVWKDHIAAYFDRKLVYGAFAVMDKTLETQPGLTINFPYFIKIGAAEEPGEDDSVNVDNLSDSSFNATVKEVSKAVGVKDKAFKDSAASKERILSEAQVQLGRVHAEKVDADLLTEFSTLGNYVQGYTATAAAHTMNIRILNQARIVGLGDRNGEAQVCFMHSKQYLDCFNDTTAGFLKMDANDPMYAVQGFMGRLLGMAIVVVDTIPASADIDSESAYHAFIHTMEPYGVCIKQEPMVESDRDILHRQDVIAAHQWYAVKSFHAKIAADNYRTVRVTTTVST